jgi:hypothetical protein
MRYIVKQYTSIGELYNIFYTITDALEFAGIALDNSIKVDIIPQ